MCLWCVCVLHDSEVCVWCGVCVLQAEADSLCPRGDPVAGCHVLEASV